MNLQPLTIQGYSAGLETNKKPFALMDTAFPQLENAYCWRERIIKREGLQLAGRLRRVLTGLSLGNTAGAQLTYTFANIFASFVPAVAATGETNKQIEPGSLVITIAAPDAASFTDNGDGTFAVTGGGVAAGSIINYATGAVTIKLTAAAGGAAISADINYFPSLPVMGIVIREISGINDEQTIFFDTKYAYTHDGENFVEYLSATGTTWAGTDADFFWATNYRGVDADVRLLFVTNYVNDASNPMRYTDGTTWTSFSPIIGSKSTTQTFTPFLGGAGPYVDTLTSTPIIPGTVVITVEATPTPIVFRDTAKDGTLTSSDAYTGTIVYATGVFTLNFSPAVTAGSYSVSATYNFGNNNLWQARILIPYYGRLLALNVWEGASIGTAVNVYNRCRFSQVGSPVQLDGWRSDTFGKGGYIDAPVNEEIVSAIFYKNTLIVFFERSTWQLRYVGEYGLPFIWERISSDFGADSTFSTILFDEGVLAVGDRAIVSSTGTNVQRIDLQIPDAVFEFNNLQSGPQRVQGIRDYKKELVFWCYSDGNLNKKFPNYSLLYNYRNNTYAIFRNNVTAYGTIKSPGTLSWDSQSVFWSSTLVTWSDTVIENAPVIVSGNQQGFVHLYGYPDMESIADSSINALDQESLSITAIDRTVNPIVITVPNHNLATNEFIYITGLNFLDADGSILATDLNDKFYQVKYVDDNNISLFQWSATAQNNVSPFTFTPASGTGTYVGGGVLALFPVLNIRTKDFNPFEKQGLSTKLAYVDLLTDAEPGAQATIKLFINSSLAVEANQDIGNTLNTLVDQSGSLPFYIPGSEYEWHRYYGGCNGQFIAINITYSKSLMNTLTTHQKLFVLNAMQMWVKQASRNIF